MAIRVRGYRRKNGKITKSYLVVITPPEGKQFTKSFRDITEAREWEYVQRAFVTSGRFRQKRKDNMRLCDLARYWLKNHAEVRKTPSSVIRDRSILKHQILPHLGNARLHDLTVDRIERWIRTLLRNCRLSPKTVMNCFCLLRKMMNDAIRWRLIPYHQLSNVILPIVPESEAKYWDKEQVSRFLEGIRFHFPHYYPVFVLALYAGLRKGEIRGLKWDCVDFKCRILTVRRTFCAKSRSVQEHTKNYRIKRIPMHLEVERVLRTMQDGDFVASNFPWNHPQRVIEPLCKVLNIPVIRFHDLRHTFASNLVMSGVAIYDVKVPLGHANIASTERYSHLSPGYLRSSLDRLDFKSASSNDTQNENNS